MVDDVFLSLPVLPPSWNRVGRGKEHWAVTKARADEWYMLIRAAVNRQGKPTQPWTRARVLIAYFFPDRRRRDPDNYAGFKPILDGLVRAGVIVDDALRNVELRLQFGVDRKNPRTEITVTPLRDEFGEKPRHEEGG